MTTVPAPRRTDRALTTRQPWASLHMVRTSAGGCANPVMNRAGPVPTTLPVLCPGGHDRPARGDGSASDDPEPCRCGPFPSRAWIHAARDRDEAAYDTVVNGWLYRPGNAGGDELWPPGAHNGTEGYCERSNDRLDVAYGALLGSVLVTQCHHSDECCPEEHRRHLSDGSWHDSCLPCLRRRQHGGHGLCSPWAEHGAYHWTVTDPRSLAAPVPARGRPGLWTLPDEVSAPFEAVAQ